jgi:hypothetical protein
MLSYLYQSIEKEILRYQCSSKNVSTETNKRRPLLLLFNEWLFCAPAENLPVDRESKQKERETAVPSAEPLLLLLNEWLFCAPTDELLSAAPKT